MRKKVDVLTKMVIDSLPPFSYAITPVQRIGVHNAVRAAIIEGMRAVREEAAFITRSHPVTEEILRIDPEKIEE